jgi:hypothetical protein
MIQNNKVTSVANLALCIFMISINGVAGSKGLFGNTVGEISNSLPNEFTPAGYAFSIWSIIFISQIAVSIVFVANAYRNNSKYDYKKQANLYSLLHVLNVCWLLSWHSLQIGISVIIMIALLITLLFIFKENRKSEFVGAKLLKWSTQLYFGWITVATIANITTFFVKKDWNLLLSESLWAAILIVIATILNSYMAMKEKAYIFSIVGVWSIIAIAVKQKGVNEMVYYVALASTLLIMISILVKVTKIASK